MKTTCIALFLMVAAFGSLLAEEEKAPGEKPSTTIISKIDRTKEFADVVTDPKVRQFTAKNGICYALKAEDHQAGKHVVKHSFFFGELACSIVFKKGASLKESRLCDSDLLIYNKVTEAVKDDGTFGYALHVESAIAITSGRSHPQIQAIVWRFAVSSG
jgi:hypothetical protein